MNFLGRLALASLRGYSHIAPTERGGFRLARLARAFVPEKDRTGNFQTPDGFRLNLDLRTYPDVAMAVAEAKLSSGRQHYELFGHGEKRSIRLVHFEPALEELRAEKMAKLQPFLRLDRPHVKRGSKLDFLTEALRTETRIVDTDLVAGEHHGPR